MMQRAIVRIPAYLAFGFAVFLIALVLTFPDQRLKEIATVQIEKQLDGKYDVTIGDLGLWWLSGVALKDVTISERVVNPTMADPAADAGAKAGPSKSGAAAGPDGPPTKQPLVITIPRIAAGISPIMSLIHLAPTVDFLVDLGGGDISGNFVQGKDQRELQVQLNKIDLSQVDLIESAVGIPMRGTLKGDIDLQLHPKQSIVTGGDIQLNGQNLTVEKSTLYTDKLGPLGFIDVPETRFGQLDAHLVVEKVEGAPRSTMRFDEFRFHQGEDVRGQIWGDISLGRTVAQSNAKLEMRFQFDDKYIRSKNLGDILRMGYFREGKNQDWYGFMLWGRLNSPRFKGAPTAATGPKAADTKDADAQQKTGDKE